MVTMLEKAISYVKFLQLQVKVSTSNTSFLLLMHSFFSILYNALN